jgi:hypothetical protein
VSINTNHLERKRLGAVPMGCSNWPFRRLMGPHRGIAQGLIATCRRHEINPYAYLVNVLPRVGQHLATDVARPPQGGGGCTLRTIPYDLFILNFRG